MRNPVSSWRRHGLVPRSDALLYRVVHLRRRIATTTIGGAETDVPAVESWQWRHDCDDSVRLDQLRPPAAPVDDQPGGLRWWTGQTAVPADPAGLATLTSGLGSPPAPAADRSVPPARLADLSGIACPTATRRAAVAGLLDTRLGIPTQDPPSPPADGSRWRLTFDPIDGSARTIDVRTPLPGGQTRSPRTTYLECRHTATAEPRDGQGIR